MHFFFFFFFEGKYLSRGNDCRAMERGNDVYVELLASEQRFGQIWHPRVARGHSAPHMARVDRLAKLLTSVGKQFSAFSTCTRLRGNSCYVDFKRDSDARNLFAVKSTNGELPMIRTDISSLTIVRNGDTLFLKIVKI